MPSELVDEVKQKISESKFNEALTLINLLPEEEMWFWKFHIDHIWGRRHIQWVDPDNTLFEKARELTKRTDVSPALLISANNVLIIDALSAELERIQDQFDVNINKIDDPEMRIYLLYHHEARMFYRNMLVLNSLEDYSQYVEQLDVLIKQARKIHEIAQETGHPYLCAKTIYNLGSIYWSKGNFREATKCVEQYVSIFEAIPDYRRVLYGYGNLADNHYALGNLERSEELFSEVLKISEKMDLRGDILRGLIGLAKICYEQGRYERALQFMLRMDVYQDDKIADESEKIGHLYKLTLLIHIYIALNYLSRAEETLVKMQEIMKLQPPVTKHSEVTLGGDFTNYLIKLSQARLYLSRRNMEDRMSAIPLLQEIVDQYKETYLNHEIYQQALLLLTEQKIIQAQYHKDLNYYEEAKKLLDLLHQFAIEQRAKILQIQVIKLQAQFLLIEGNITSAIDKFDQALTAAKTMGLVHLAEDIEEDQQKFQRELIYWKNVIEQNTEISELIEKSRVKEYLKYIQQRNLM